METHCRCRPPPGQARRATALPWDAYGDTVQMAYTVTNDINVWQAQVVRYNATSDNWWTVADLHGPPYEYTFNTSELNFGYNEFAIDLYTVELQTLRGANIWLYRRRVPESITELGESYTLEANGQDTAQVILELRDRGGNLLPEVVP